MHRDYRIEGCQTLDLLKQCIFIRWNRIEHEYVKYTDDKQIVYKQESHDNGGTSLEMIASGVTSKEVVAIESRYRLRRDDYRHRRLQAWQYNTRVTTAM